jgi:hypothetical protein
MVDPARKGHDRDAAAPKAEASLAPLSPIPQWRGAAPERNRDGTAKPQDIARKSGT